MHPVKRRIIKRGILPVMGDHIPAGKLKADHRGRWTFPTVQLMKGKILSGSSSAGEDLFVTRPSTGPESQK
jgi:hypothetical protein